MIVPYFKNQRSIEGLDERQKDLVIMDTFTGQMTPEILDNYKAYNLCVINVPANMTKYCQPLDLAVNFETKCFLNASLLIGIQIKFRINSVKANR